MYILITHFSYYREGGFYFEMKKILISILLFLSFSIKVEAKVEESVITDFFIRDKKSRELYEFNFYNDGETVLYSTKFVPYILNYEFDFIKSYEEVLNLDKDAWNHLKNIIYFGFQYQNHDDILWYALTQAMIYQELGLNYEIVDLNNMNILMSYRTEYMQLRSLVKKHENLPEIYKDVTEINIDYKEYLRAFLRKSSFALCKIGNKLLQSVRF